MAGHAGEACGERDRLGGNCDGGCAGQGLGVAGVVVEGDPYLDGLGQLGAGQEQGGAGGPADGGAVAEPLVGVRDVAEAVAVGDGRCIGVERLVDLWSPADGRQTVGWAVDHGAGGDGRRCLAGCGLGETVVVVEGDGYLDSVSLLAGGEQQAGSGGAVDVGTAGGPLVVVRDVGDAVTVGDR